MKPTHLGLCVILLFVVVIGVFAWHSYAFPVGSMANLPTFRLVAISLNESREYPLYRYIGPESTMEVYRVYVTRAGRDDSFEMIYHPMNHESELFVAEADPTFGLKVTAGSPHEAVEKYLSGAVPIPPIPKREYLPGDIKGLIPSR